MAKSMSAKLKQVSHRRRENASVLRSWCYVETKLAYGSETSLQNETQSGV